MKIKTLQCYAVGLMMSLALGAPVRATDADDTTQIKTDARAMEKENLTKQQKIDLLAKEFNVPPSTVEKLRNQGQGWGEISIGLAMSQQLMKTDPSKYPTLTDALNKIEALRASKMGWGKIANDLGFKLGPAISEAHSMRHEMEEAAEKGRSEKMEHRPDADDMNHAEKSETMERPEHSEQPERPDIERPERAGH